MGFTLCSV